MQPKTRSPRPRPSRQEVAFHEAGHIVVAYLTGFYLVDGDVLLDGDRYAETPIKPDLRLLSIRVQEECWSPPDQLTLIRQECFVAAAGFAAELVYSEKLSRSFDLESASLGALGDREHVMELWGPGDCFYRFAREMAEVIRDEGVWNIVTDVAGLLLGRGRVCADELLGRLEEAREKHRVSFRLFASADPALQAPSPRAP